jgi:hypothetical protein
MAYRRNHEFFRRNNTLEIIREYGSIRIHSRDLYDLLGGSERLMRTFDMNGGDDGMLEIQSVSGFINCIRRYAVDMLISKDTDTQEIIYSTGISHRTIQRARRNKFRQVIR